MIPCGFRLILEQEFERAQDFQSSSRFDSHSRACPSLVSGGRQKPSGRRREFSGRSIHWDAQSALPCPFYFEGFHNNKP